MLYSEALSKANHIKSSSLFLKNIEILNILKSEISECRHDPTSGEEHMLPGTS